ncbi:MAG: aminotransferase class V-fold PLP-dependent enzyme [Myxococcales bacterium]|nr:aminotransferase class V-fold PLP-dependent enzyme [Myxococcales bacterium]
MTRLRLLNPGPVTLTARVRESLTQPDLCHREPEFAAMQRDVRGKLEAVYSDAKAQGFVAILLTGSGTAAVEAMVGSCVPRDGHGLVVANGVYGERMAAMLTAQGKRFTMVNADWLAGIDLAAAERALAADPSVTHVLSVQHETTTGRLNDIAALGALCKKYNKKLLLDAVSSFGAEAIDFTGWNLEAVAATANKCLHGVPGVCFVLVAEAALAGRPSGATSVYLDLWRHWKEQPNGWSPFTQSVQSVYALQAALDEFSAEGGWQSRAARYAARAKRVREVVRAAGVSYFLADGETASSNILMSFAVPAHTRYETLHDRLKAQGFIIYAGQGPYAGKMFRIAVMGDLTDADMGELCEALTALLARPD